MTPSQVAKGFTLIETAIVLLIVAIALGGLVISLGQSAENSKRAEAQLQIRRIEEALYGYAQSTGRLPCPSSVVSAGAEAPPGGGNCLLWHGFVPSRTLGINGPTNSDGLLLDPWGNPYRYSVARLQTPADGSAFSSTAGLRWTFNNNNPMALSGDLIRVCADSSCTTPLSDTVPAVVLSMGANWSSFNSAAEVLNGGGTSVGGYRLSAGNDFVSAGYSELNFDDIILWISPNILYSRMITAGVLP
jgi:prepilin-type N-terminal cleavage/methylation domain-containing protein